MDQNKWSFVIHERGTHRTAEVIGDGAVVHTAADVLDMLASIIWNDDAQDLVIHEANIVPEFFDLRTGVLGDILQKCSNYRFRLALIGDFDKYEGASLQAFMTESNRGRHVLFVKTLEDALRGLAGSK